MITNNPQIKSPLLSPKLSILKSLENRMKIPMKTKSKITTLTKGYQGEIAFSSLLRDHLRQDPLLLHNLLLNYDESIFEIDSLLLTKNHAFIFEVKNYTGDFIVKDNKWYKDNDNFEVRNPLLQVERSEYLFRKLLTQLRFNFKVKPYLIFINNEFTLYSPTINNQIILPTQLRRFFKHLQTISYDYSSKHYQLIEALSRKQQSTTYVNSRLPEYHFDQLQKGILCTCYSFLRRLSRRYLFCDTCHSKVIVDTAVLSSIKEYHRLFPNRKITTHAIYKWCHIIPSKKTIRRILTNNFQQIYGGRYTYYKYPEHKR